MKTKRYKITSGTKEWADHNVNCALGCFNDCRYCYAKKMAIRFGRAPNETWKDMKIREDIKTKSFRKMKGRVMFPTSHDIVDIPYVEEACMFILGKLLDSGNRVLVTTKPRINIIRKIDELFSHYEEQVQFRFTITSINDELLRFWEPNALLFKERMESLEYAFYRGYKTSVSIEPFLDYDPENLLRTVEQYCTESIWIGKMNYIPKSGIEKNEIPYFNNVRKNCELYHLKEIYMNLKDHPKVRFKDSIINKLNCSER